MSAKKTYNYTKSIVQNLYWMNLFNLKVFSVWVIVTPLQNTSSKTRNDFLYVRKTLHIVRYLWTYNLIP